MARLTRTEREALRRRIDEATRAALPPSHRVARPGHPSRFTGLASAAPSTGREVTRPSLDWYDQLRPARPAILAHLNG